MENPINQEFNAQAQLQKQATDAEQNVNAPYMLQNQQMAQAALVEQINPNKILQEFKLTLSGKEEDELGNIKEISDPLMNEEGIGNMILIMRSIVNQNTVMSALEDKEISKLIIQLGDDVTDDLTLNWKEYGITDKIKLDIIESMILNVAFLSLKRALRGGERNFLGKITVENISTTPRLMQPRKENFLSRFKL